MILWSVLPALSTWFRISLWSFKYTQKKESKECVTGPKIFSHTIHTTAYNSDVNIDSRGRCNQRKQLAHKLCHNVGGRSKKEKTKAFKCLNYESATYYNVTKEFCVYIEQLFVQE